MFAWKAYICLDLYEYLFVCLLGGEEIVYVYLKDLRQFW